MRPFASSQLIIRMTPLRNAEPELQREVWITPAPQATTIDLRPQLTPLLCAAQGGGEGALGRGPDLQGHGNRDPFHLTPAPARLTAGCHVASRQRTMIARPRSVLTPGPPIPMLSGCRSKTSHGSSPTFGIGLTPEQLSNLEVSLRETLVSSPCDRTLRHTRAWLEHSRLPGTDRVVQALAERGGNCDCQVLNNVAR